MVIEASSSANIFSPEIPWYLRDLILPLLVTFITYVVTRVLFTPISKWRKMRDEMIIISVQYANYVAYSYKGEDGKKTFEDRGLYSIVEQDLRRLAGKICTLSDYYTYRFKEKRKKEQSSVTVNILLKMTK